ncbi:Gfo/Idh/MocA family protein [Hominifimenecus sp. rT4P-3]|uniref:Gfo/Idh/MocA family protein n=1 Tax=Hominifimenecus sp. rT4P-3 TaxID=3242979 RepID=UPI003DA4798D
MEKKIGIGIIGAGYASWLHLTAYEKVGKIPFEIRMISDVDRPRAEQMAAQFGIPGVTTDYEELLRDPKIDIIDIVTPPVLHGEMIEKAMKAGKHVICEKPLTGYFGGKEDPAPIGLRVSKSHMLETVLKDMDQLRKVVEAGKGRFMYAENFVYCPPMVMAAQMIEKRKSRILFMKGEESLNGSSSVMAGRWDKTGGGSLVRVGCHPLTGMLWLKSVEAKARGEKIEIVSVSADMSTVTPSLTEEEHRHIPIRPQDVEDIASVSVGFSDGTKALVIATDVCLGGAKNYVELYCNDANFVCNMTPADILQTYLPDERGLEGMELGFGLSTKTGWNKPFAADDVIRGYIGEFQDFLECVAEGREPLSGFDLAYDAVKVMYAAYQSAEEGRKIYF